MNAPTGPGLSLAARSRFLRRASGFLFGTPAPRAVPERVRKAIAADQRSSEILVCLAQFGAIAFFGGFYALTPKAFPPSVPFEPVPAALAAYTIVTALRLWLALRGRLTPLWLGASVVIDIAVLMVTIWSFHLQYQQPATIYLKAPTLLYVFILIALRTMRFEAVYVLLAGLAAVIGWCALIVYAVAAPGGMRVTHDFVAYMTSHAVLIGAEVDKLLSIAAVTAVLAIAIVRARRLLVRAATEAHAASELSRFFAPEVAGEIRLADTALRPGDATMREAAAMMIDLRGFTRLSARLDPVETLALLSEYQRRMVAAIRAHGGSIDKYLGDGILATFGAVRPSPSCAADALRALVAVTRAAEAWSRERIDAGEDPASIGTGVAIGPMLFGVTGDASRLEFTVIGDPVNLAAKLEKHCKAVGRPALASAATLDLAIAQGFEAGEMFERLPPAMVSGVSAPLRLVALRSASG